MGRFHRQLSVSFVAAVLLLALGVAAPAARAQACGVPIDVGSVNGGFEQPGLNPGTYVSNPDLPGWEEVGRVVLWGANDFVASQYVIVGGSAGAGSVSQVLDGLALAGTTVTFTITSLSSGTITLGAQGQAVIGSNFPQETHTVTFDVPADAPANLVLTLSSSSWGIDQISGAYEVPCPVVPPGCQDAVNGVGPFAGAEIVWVADGGNGSPGNQVIIGTDDADVINGRSGNDLICGGGGDDVLRGGSGNDVLDGGAGLDTCKPGSGNDQEVSCEG